MSITHTITLGVASGGNVLSRSFAVVGGSEIDVSEPIPWPSTDLQVAFAAVRAKIKSFCMVADQAITVKTNSNTVPANTFDLSIPGQPVVWYEGHPVAINSFLAADITTLFITNDSGDLATLTIKCLLDPT